MESLNNKPRAVLYIILAAIFFTGMGACANHALMQVPIADVLFARFFGLFVCLLPLILLKRQLRKVLPPKNKLKWYFARSTAGFLAACCFFYSLKYIPLAMSVLLSNSAPLFVPIMVWLIFSIRVLPKLYYGMIVGFIGVLLILHPHHGFLVAGALIALLSGIVRSLVATLLRKLARTEAPLKIIFFYALTGSVYAGILLIFSPAPVQHIPWRTLIFLAVFGGLNQFMLTLAYHSAPARFVAPFSYLSVVFALLADWIFWHIAPSMLMLIGMVIVLTGVLMTSNVSRKIEVK